MSYSLKVMNKNLVEVIMPSKKLQMVKTTLN